MTQHDFDSWLEAELHGRFAWSRDRSQVAMNASASDLASRKIRMRSRLSALPLAGRVAVALAAATISLGAVGAAAATAVTHSVNPDAWGQQVRQAVQDCKQNLSVTQHGIGGCVSAFAKQHGAANESDKASPSPGKSDGANAGAAGNASGHGSHATSPSGKANGKSDQAPGHATSPSPGNPHGPGTNGKPDQPHPGPSPRSHP